MKLAILGLLAGVVCATACKRSGGGNAKPRCFEVVVGDNSRGTRQLFQSQSCQGGGVTWAAILAVFVRRHGSVGEAIEEPGAMAGAYRVKTPAGESWFAIDDEGDAALFCTPEDTLFKQIQADYARANKDKADLTSAMALADPLDLECESTGRPSQLPALLPPPTKPDHLVREEKAAHDLVEKALTEHPAWCWKTGHGGVQFKAGGTLLRLHSTERAGDWSLDDGGMVGIVLRSPLALRDSSRPGGLYSLVLNKSGGLETISEKPEVTLVPASGDCKLREK